MIIDQNFNLYDDGNYCAEVPVSHIQVFQSFNLQMFATLANELTGLCLKTYGSHGDSKWKYFSME